MVIFAQYLIIDLERNTSSTAIFNIIIHHTIIFLMDKMSSMKILINEPIKVNLFYVI